MLGLQKTMSEFRVTENKAVKCGVPSTDFQWSWFNDSISIIIVHITDLRIVQIHVSERLRSFKTM